MGSLEDNRENLTYLSDAYVAGRDVYESTDSVEKPNGVLRVIKGPLAEWDKLNRNKRMYSEKLWDKVLESSYLKEQLRYKTLYGEGNHPVDRYEVDFSRVSHSITDMWKVPESNQIFGTINILDTPMGRILNTLYEAGGVIGYSSRAGGVLHQKKDYIEVDEDTFNFITFDAVPYPSVVAARPSVVTEGVELDTIKEQLSDEVHEKLCKIINESSSENRDSLKDFIYSIEGYDMSREIALLEGHTEDVQKMEKVIENAKVASKEESTLALLKESTLQIDNLKATNGALQSANNSLTVENEALKKSLGESLTQVTKLVNESKIMERNSTNLESQHNDTIRGLSKRIEELKSIIEDKELELSEFEDIKEAFEVVRRENKGLHSEVAQTKAMSSHTDDEYKALEEQYKTEIKEAYDEIGTLVEEVGKKDSIIKTLEGSVEELTESCETLKNKCRTMVNESKMTSDADVQISELQKENKKLSSELESLNESMNMRDSRAEQFAEDLISVISSNYNLTVESVKRKLPVGYTKSDIYMVCESLSNSEMGSGVTFSNVIAESFENNATEHKTVSQSNEVNSPKVGDWFSSSLRRG